MASASGGWFSMSSSSSYWNKSNWSTLKLLPIVYSFCILRGDWGSFCLLFRTLLKPLLPETFFLRSGEAFACEVRLTKLWFYFIIFGPGNKLSTLASSGDSLGFCRNIMLSISSPRARYALLGWLLIDGIDLIDLYDCIMAGISS